MARMVACIVLLWAICCVNLSNSSQDLDSDLIETETGWQFDDDVEVFDGNATAPTATPAVKAPKNIVPLINGDFESTNVTGNTTTLADATATTMIPNWLPGGAGVQVIFNAGYQMAPDSPKSVFAIHLNNPASTANGTQGLIATTLATNPTTGKSYTVQYDCARMPDGPINLLSALKISSISGTTTNSWILHKVRYNATDTAKQITWVKQSFVYSGTGASTKIQFESMSEKYGPIIDNVIILNGKHPLSAAPCANSKLALWQQMFPIFTVIVLMAFHCPLTHVISTL